MMRRTTAATAVIAALLATGCWGYSSRDNEAIGQPKKIHHVTPLVCSDYDTIDMSLGVMRNGVGSVSTQDIELAFAPHNDEANENLLKKAIEDGKIVKFTYDERRFSWCQKEKQIKTVEILDSATTPGK